MNTNQLVRMTWAGGTRLGRLVGDIKSDALKTGAAFAPVEWADGTTDNVDTRVLSSLIDCEADEVCGRRAAEDRGGRALCDGHAQGVAQEN